MIRFKVIRWKNFLSTGNAFSELVLDQHPTNLVVGENGSGKSTGLTDALCFVLYGKAYRNINKPQLTNSINKKNCVVELEFSVSDVEYKVVRGLKPAVFEIWRNGEMMNQDSSARDYQKVLEENILQLNFKSFTQIILLGSAAYVPFMQLTPATRREIIEDLLDIKIFSEMNEVLKEKVSIWKETLRDTENKIEVLKQSAKIQKGHVDAMSSDLRDRRTALEQTKQELIQKRDAALDRKEQYEQRMAEIGNVASVKDEITTLTVEIRSLQSKLVDLDERIAEAGDATCPTCAQPMNAEAIEKNLAALHAKRTTTALAIATKTEKRTQLEQEEQDNAELLSQLQIVNDQWSQVSGELKTIAAEVSWVTKNLEEIQTADGNYDVEREKLQQMVKQGKAFTDARNTLLEEKDYYDAAATLLKDTGIKTRVIRQYIPVINKLVNKYLRLMDFFVSFELDEKFDEHIKSRHRDDFSYESFSEGEKQRIDLALTFTWRQIAAMKNSAHTNLFVLDEVFDSSLDAAGTEYLMTMINTLGANSNVWVISHRGDHLHDKFSNSVRFEKRKNFSVIV